MNLSTHKNVNLFKMLYFLGYLVNVNSWKVLKKKLKLNYIKYSRFSCRFHSFCAPYLPWWHRPAGCRRRGRSCSSCRLKDGVISPIISRVDNSIWYFSWISYRLSEIIELHNVIYKGHGLFFFCLESKKCLTRYLNTLGLFVEKQLFIKHQELFFENSVCY